MSDPRIPDTRVPDPWLTIIGIGEDGLPGLPDASRAALAAAGAIFGGPRHLALAEAGDRGREWPVPFDIAPVLALTGSKVVVLVSGDPFWFGAGSVLAAALPPGEWRAIPVAGSFSVAAARLGWRLEDTACLGLHAAPFERLVPHLHPGQRLLCTLRDGAAVAGLAGWLVARGLGESRLTALEALGGPQERSRGFAAAGPVPQDIAAPVLVAIEPAGVPGLPRSPGLPETAFVHDGQITKSPVRALTLAALAPRPGALLWDLGAGSGSVSVEWALAGGRAVAVECRAGRLANIRANADRFGLSHRLDIRQGRSADLLADLPRPDAIFVGGGFDGALFARLPRSARLVVNAVTLETEALVVALHALHGGDLLRIELARAAPLGGMRGWQAARPVVQWSLPCA